MVLLFNISARNYIQTVHLLPGVLITATGRMRRSTMTRGNVNFFLNFLYIKGCYLTWCFTHIGVSLHFTFFFVIMSLLNQSYFLKHLVVMFLNHIQSECSSISYGTFKLEFQCLHVIRFLRYFFLHSTSVFISKSVFSISSKLYAPHHLLWSKLVPNT